MQNKIAKNIKVGQIAQELAELLVLMLDEIYKKKIYGKELEKQKKVRVQDK